MQEDSQLFFTYQLSLLWFAGFSDRRDGDAWSFAATLKG
jgi:hypothetical protein